MPNTRTSWLKRIWQIIVESYQEWQGRSCAQLAAALACYGILALSGLALVGLYVVTKLRAFRTFDVSQPAGHAGGPADAGFVLQLLHAAQARHDTWIALAAGILIFAAGVVMSALLLQDGLNKIWERPPTKLREAAHHVPEFAAILALSFVLILLLFVGAAIHALISRTHRVSLLIGILYQGADVIITVAVLTVAFLFVLAYIAPVRSPWRKVWLASLLSAILYERGQFGLSIYIGQMDPRSPYALLGALVSVILWILYSAEIVYVGAVLTKVLASRGRARKRAT